MPTANTRTAVHDIAIPAPVAAAWRMQQRDAQINRLLANAIGAEDAVDAHLALTVPEGSIPEHVNAHDAAAELCRRLSAVFAHAAERIAPEASQKPQRSYEYVA